MKRTTKVILITLAILVLSFIIVIAAMFLTFDHDLNSKRNTLATKYANNTTLPMSLVYKSRTAGGDGIDSQPYWSYMYSTSADSTKTLNDLRATLQKSGYKVSDIEDSTTPGIDPSTRYEFRATKDAAQINLVVILSKDHTAQITVQNE